MGINDLSGSGPDVFESCVVDSAANACLPDSCNRLVNLGQLHHCLSFEFTTERPREDLCQK